ncbi:hypothetical protein BC938DRAFT_471491 [Jimgerdemannia flammicorona]|uniref:Uncharacterized protein n=1 Tax=Jimgerdemannia flammicorona TaxID=994334 RepID=A0A433Q810_9FUNG|nr:hypothetical protein BC938DRAFT_471491 [Jimgerdemannia flammicorona]
MTRVYAPGHTDNPTSLPEHEFRTIPMEACTKVAEALALFIRIHYEDSSQPKYKAAIDAYMRREALEYNYLAITDVLRWEEKSLRDGVRVIRRAMSVTELTTATAGLSVSPFAISQCAGLFYDHRCHRDHRRGQTDIRRDGSYIARQTALWMSGKQVEYELIDGDAIRSVTAAQLRGSVALLVDEFEEVICDVYLAISDDSRYYYHDEEIFPMIETCAKDAIRLLLDNIENNPNTNHTQYWNGLDAYSYLT